MRFVFLFVSILIVLSGGRASAGTAVSGGGDAVFCKSAGTAELLDQYEARVVRGIMEDYGGGNLSYMQKVALILSRLAPFDPARAGKYSARAKSFMSEARFLTGVDLPGVPDTGAVVLPKGCELKQVAVQQTPAFPQDPYYMIDKDIWDVLSEDSKAGLVLHEIIYREAIEAGQKNSIKVRYFNSMIASAQFTQTTAKEYLDLVNNSGLGVEFLWLAPSGQWWYLVNRATAYGEKIDTEKNCRDLGGRLPNGNDVLYSYPKLGQRLVELGQVQENVMPADFIFVIVVDSVWKGGRPYELASDGFDGSRPGITVGFDYASLMCLFKSNPFPL